MSTKPMQVPTDEDYRLAAFKVAHWAVMWAAGDLTEYRFRQVIEDFEDCEVRYLAPIRAALDSD